MVNGNALGKTVRKARHLRLDNTVIIKIIIAFVNDRSNKLPKKSYKCV